MLGLHTISAYTIGYTPDATPGTTGKLRSHTTDVLLTAGSTIAVPAYVQTLGTVGLSTGTLSITGTVTAGNAIIVSFSSNGSYAVPTDSKGNTYTLLGSYGQQKVYGAIANSSGSNTISSLIGSGNTNMTAVEYSGTSLTVDTTATNTGSNSIPSATSAGATTSANDLIIATVSSANSYSASLGAGYSHLTTNTNQSGVPLYTEDLVQSATASFTSAFGASSFFNWFVLAVALKAGGITSTREMARYHSTDVNKLSNITKSRFHTTDSSLRTIRKTQTHTTDVYKLPSSYSATPAFVQSVKGGSSSNASPQTVTFPSATTVGNLVTIVANHQSPITAGNVTDTGGNTWTHQVSNYNSDLDFWWTIVVTPFTVASINTGGTSGWPIEYIGQEFSGVATTSPLDASATRLISNNPDTSSVTTTQTGDLIINYGGNSSTNMSFAGPSSGYSNFISQAAEAPYQSFAQSKVSSIVGVETATINTGSAGGGQTGSIAFKNGNVIVNRPQARRHTTDVFLLPSTTKQRRHTTDVNKFQLTYRKTHSTDVNIKDPNATIISKFRNLYEIIGQGAGGTSTTYADAITTSDQAKFNWNPNDWDGVQAIRFGTAISANANGGVAYAQLYDYTNNVAIAGSEVIWTALTYANGWVGYVTSGDISANLPSTPAVLGIQYKVGAGSTNTGISSGQLIVDMYNGTKITETIVASEGGSITGTTPMQHPWAKDWQYDSSKFDNITGFYLELNFNPVTAGNTLSIDLYDLTAGTVVDTFSATGAGFSMQRTGNMVASLVNGHVYSIRGTNSLSTTSRISSGRWIIQQINATKTQQTLHAAGSGATAGTVAQGKVSLRNGTYAFDKTNYDPSIVGLGTFWPTLAYHHVDTSTTLSFNSFDRSSGSDVGTDNLTTAGSTARQITRGSNSISAGGTNPFILNNNSGTKTGNSGSQIDAERFVMDLSITNYPNNISTIVDNFNDNTQNTAIWGYFSGTNSTVVETNQRLEMNQNASAVGSPDEADALAQVQTYRFVGGQFFAQIVSVSADATKLAQMYVNLGTGYSMTWGYTNGSLYARYSSNGTTTTLATLTYNSAVHVYWRLREAGGNYYWDTSTNGSTWTQQATVASAAVGGTNYKNTAGFVLSSSSAGTASQFIIDNVNVPTTPTYTRSHTTGTNKRQSAITRTHTTDIFKRKVFTLTHTTSVNKTKTTTRTHTTDTLKRITVLKTHTTDTNKRKSGILIVHSTDINKRKAGLLKTHTTDTLKRAAFIRTHLTDTNKRKSGVLRTHTTDTVKRKTNTSSHTTSTVLRRASTLAFSTDTVKRAQNVRTHSTDAYKRGSFTRSHSTDVNKLKSGITRSHTTDVNKRKSGILLIHSTDTLKRKVTTRSHTTDTLKRVSSTRTHSTDTFKRAQVVKTHATDTFKRGQYTRTHSTDVNKRKINSKTHTTDVNKTKAGILKTHTTDVNKRLSGNIRSHTADTNKRKINALAHSTDTLKRKAGISRTHSTDVFKRLVGVKTHTTSTFLRLSSTRNHTTDTYLRQRALYSREDNASIPTGITDLATPFNSTDYANIATRDFTYVDQNGSGNELFLFKRENVNSTDGVNITVIGKSTTATTTKPVYLQIWNFTTSSWETIAQDNTTAANTDFTLTGSQLTNMSNYYNSNINVVRAYQ